MKNKIEYIISTAISLILLEMGFFYALVGIVRKKFAENPDLSRHIRSRAEAFLPHRASVYGRKYPHRVQILQNCCKAVSFQDG